MSDRRSCPGFAGPPLSRREMLRAASNGFGYLALSALLAKTSRAEPVRAPHFKPKAKNVIFLFMPGGVSHMDTFDPKSKLAELDGKESVGKRKWLKSPWTFKQYGQIGLPVSELFPEITPVVDDLTVVRSMKSEFPVHSRANIFLHTGRNFGGYPSIGSWVNYGLGSENKDLPGYLLLTDGDTPAGGMENFSNGFLPATYQAMEVRAQGAPVENITPADSGTLQRLKLDAAAAGDRNFLAGVGADPGVEAAIANMEMAYRMQSLAPDLLRLDQEPESVKKLYGLDAKHPQKRFYATQCLRARRLVEAGVRFVEISCPLVIKTNGTWDQHSDLKKGHELNAMVTDQPVAGLLKDLKARGLLNETLVVWAGEFGRTPDTITGDGRDHHPDAFTIWMAGGGAKPGLLYGTSDDIGKDIAENPVTIHDLHATVLRLLGLDHSKLSYRFGGRDVTLADVHGKVIDALIA